MYIRQLKQFLRGVDAAFDERKYGFETLGDLMRACQRDGLLRIERDRQGGMRIFPGTVTPATDAASHEPAASAETPDSDAVAEPVESFESGWVQPVEPSGEAEVVEGSVLQEIEVPSVVDAEEAPLPADRPSRRRPRAAKAARPGPAEPRAPRKSTATASRQDPAASAPAGSKTRKSAGRPKTPRSRPRSDVSQE
jgi:hypothetical protein